MHNKQCTFGDGWLVVIIVILLLLLVVLVLLFVSFRICFCKMKEIEILEDVIATSNNTKNKQSTHTPECNDGGDGIIAAFMIR
jgi:hypothetical protein